MKKNSRTSHEIGKEIDVKSEINWEAVLENGSTFRGKKKKRGPLRFLMIASCSLLVLAIAFFAVTGYYVKKDDDTYRYLAIGNSITSHPVTSFWWGSWGMAASSMDKDYVHVVTSYLEQQYEHVGVQALYYTTWEDASTKEEREQSLSELDQFLTKDLNCVSIQLGENIRIDNDPKIDYQNLINYVHERAPKAQIILIGNFFQWDDIDDIKEELAQQDGIDFLSLKAIQKPEYQVGKGTEVFGDDGKRHTITYDPVARHPNDAGMAYIAQQVIDSITKYEATHPEDNFAEWKDLMKRIF